MKLLPKLVLRRAPPPSCTKRRLRLGSPCACIAQPMQRRFVSRVQLPLETTPQQVSTEHRDGIHHGHEHEGPVAANEREDRYAECETGDAEQCVSLELRPLHALQAYGPGPHAVPIGARGF